MGITTNGLVLYLPLYSTDLQGSSITSKDSSQTLCDVTGAVWGNKGRTFDGSDDVILCGDGTSLDLITAMTLEAWVKIGKVTGTYQFIMGRDDGTNRSFYLQQLLTGMSAGFWSSNVNKNISAGTTLIIATWYHFVVTYDKVSLKIFTNGVLDCAPLAETGNIDNDNVSFTIGARDTSPVDRDFQGIIGEARVYNRALSTTEISDIYNETIKTYKACWGFFSWA